MTQSLVVHITYFHKDPSRNPSKRISYLQRILDEYDKFTCVSVDIFIHTNTSIDNVFDPPKNCSFNIIVHKLRKDENPHYLTWKCRNLLKSQRNDFDYFCYCEDDILMKESTFQYWLKYKDQCIENQYNLGFLRIETDKHKNIYALDLTKKLNAIVTINDVKFVENNVNPYCALWIYDKKEFNKIIDSNLYDLENNNIKGYTIRCTSAIGVHGLNNNWYKSTIIPLKENGCVVEECTLPHLENNYVGNHKQFSTIKLNEIIG